MVNNNGPVTIGPQTLVDFPRFGIDKVPAKVDTGADSSSVWASGIKERGGILTFCLFAPGSRYYTGQHIKTRDYEILSVRNSFGQTEFRYKVRLKITIEGRLINVRFSLADRSANRFPVLIGRRTLRGRFLVDVSGPAAKTNLRVLVFNEKSTNIKPVKQLFRNLEKRLPGAKFTLSDYGNLRFIIDGKGSRAELLQPKKKLADFDLVYFKTSLNSRDIATSAAAYLETRSVPVLNRGVTRHFTNNKLKQYVVLAANGIRLPKTYFVQLDSLKTAYGEVAAELGRPFILKDILGKKGRDNFLITDEPSFKAACRLAKEKGLELIAQQFIPNNGDYRLLVLGAQLRLATHRQAAPGTHTNNISAGGTATLADKRDIPGHVQRAAVKAAKAMELDIAGVDMVQDKNTGEWYCLEVNAGPQLATGAFVEEKEGELGVYLQRKLSGLF